MNMKCDFTLDFPDEEIQMRISKAQTLMKKTGVDCLLLTQFENLYYFSGYLTWLIRTSKHRPSILLLPANRQPILIIPDLEVPAAAPICAIKDIRGWKNDYVGLWVDTITELGLKEGRFGAELGEESNLGMPINDWDSLKANIPQVEWVDAQPMLYELRMIKSELEAAYMREAARISGEACDAAWHLLSYAMRNGKQVTEKDIAAVMGETMMREGALIPGFINVRSGSAQGMMHNKYPTDRVIQKGDWIAMDYGSIYKNYNSDLIRVASFGKPLKRWEDLYNKELEIAYKIHAAVKPGVTVKELCRIKEEIAHELNVDLPWAGIGHSIGLNIHELPRINPDVDQVLKPGMCFTVEPGIETDGNTFCVEDDVMVTENGMEIFTTYPRELFIA